MFAKLYDVKEDRQVLVYKDENDCGEPIMVAHIEGPHDVMGVMHLSGFPDSDDGWAARDHAFDNIDEAAAMKLAESIEKDLLEECSDE